MCSGKLQGPKFAKANQNYDRAWSEAETISLCDALTLTFITPTELLNGGEPNYEPDFGAVMDSLFGRIAAIVDNYGTEEFVIPYSLFANKPLVTAKYDLQIVHIKTNGQPINGFVGTISLRGDITLYLPYIDLGSQIHLGKKTTRSCGEYNFEMEELKQ
jgi:hypothetical protein